MSKPTECRVQATDKQSKAERTRTMQLDLATKHRRSRHRRARAPGTARRDAELEPQKIIEVKFEMFMNTWSDATEINSFYLFVFKLR